MSRPDAGQSMRVGLVSYWFNRGQAVVSRRIRAALDAAGVQTFVLARPTKDNFVRSRFIDCTGPWAQRGVTAATRFDIPAVEYLEWAADNVLDVVLCDQNLQFAELAAVRRRGVRTVGRFVWEAFRPEDAAGARAAFDTIYSVTRCEQRRYAGLGIASPLIRWAPPPELATIPRPPRHDGEVRFFFPGGYLSDRKPTAEAIAAFQRVRDPRARLILKIQDPVRGPQLAAEAERADPRIRVITADLPDDDHYRLMASCDVLLAPTRWEGLGLHHGEAIALGLPAITNDFAPMNENVAHDVDGWLVPAVWQAERVPGVPRLETPVEPLAAAIEALCDDDRRARLAAGVARRRAAVTWADTSADLVELVTGWIAPRAAA